MKTIRNVGKIKIINEIGDGIGRRVASDFLDRLIVTFAKQSTKYIRSISDAPFAYRERQLHSIFAPAISTITDSFLMEYPIERKWDEERKKDWNDYTGWLDYWCRYRNIDFFIELKHNYDSYKNDEIRKDTFANWDYMNNTQLEIVKNEAKRHSEFCKGVLLVSLQVVTIYDKMQTTKIPQSCGDVDTLVSTQKNYFENLNPKPNWSGLWMLNDDIYDLSSREYDTQTEYYPGVMLIAKVCKIIK